MVHDVYRNVKGACVRDSYAVPYTIFFLPQPANLPAEWDQDPEPRLFYHAFMILEVEGGLAICTEKYNDKLELVFGEKQLLSTYARSYRATGDQRKPSTQHSQCKVERYVSLQDVARRES